MARANLLACQYPIEFRSIGATVLGQEKVRAGQVSRFDRWFLWNLVDLLREHNIALVLIDQAWMPRPAQWFEKFDPITADFAYIRLLGDRQGIEKQTKVWDKVIVDRTQELHEWIGFTVQIIRRGIPVFIYVNNHYAGHAPATVRQFQEPYQALQELKS